jgi:hypothetical protein
MEKLNRIHRTHTVSAKTPSQSKSKAFKAAFRLITPPLLAVLWQALGAKFLLKRENWGANALAPAAIIVKRKSLRNMVYALGHKTSVDYQQSPQPYRAKKEWFVRVRASTYSPVADPQQLSVGTD